MGLGIFLIMVYLSSVDGEVIVVDCNNKNNHNEIQSAINDSMPGDTISISAGIYYENILVDKELYIIGNRTESVIIAGIENKEVICLNAANITLSNVSIQPTLETVNSGALKITSDYQSISNITIISDESCVDIQSAHHIELFNTTCDNAQVGINIEYSEDVIIESCHIRSKDAGIRLKNSKAVYLKMNSMCLRLRNNQPNLIY